MTLLIELIDHCLFAHGKGLANDFLVQLVDRVDLEELYTVLDADILVSVRFPFRVLIQLRIRVVELVHVAQVHCEDQLDIMVVELFVSECMPVYLVIFLELLDLRVVE